MLGPFATASRRTPIHQVSLPVLSHTACASMSTTTTTTRDRGDGYGPMEWAQLARIYGSFYMLQHSKRLNILPQGPLFCTYSLAAEIASVFLAVFPDNK